MDETTVETPAVETPSVETPAATPAETAPAATPAVETTAVSAPVNFDSLKLPEGMALDDGFKGLIGDMKLDGSQAQKLLDYAQENIFSKIQEAQTAKRNETIEKWTQEAKSQFPGEKLEIAKNAYKQFVTPELKSFLDETGLGNNPAMIGLFYNLGKMMGEGRLVIGGAAPQEKSAGEVLFGKSIADKG